MRTSNPTLSASLFGRAGYSGLPMTLQGTVNKTALLLALVALPAMYTWHLGITTPGAGTGLMLAGVFGGFILAMVTCFKQTWAPVTAPLYAVAEGLFLGGISAIFEARFHGIAMQAILLTFGTLFAMLAAYTMRWIRATEKFKLGVIAATGGIALVYFVSMILSFFGIHTGIFGNGMLGLGISIFVVIIAALNLVLDFDIIEQGCIQGAPKYMEWYAGFSLLVTLVWLYMEILRLLAILAARRD